MPGLGYVPWYTCRAASRSPMSDARAPRGCGCAPSLAPAGRRARAARTRRGRGQRDRAPLYRCRRDEKASDCRSAVPMATICSAAWSIASPRRRASTSSMRMGSSHLRSRRSPDKPDCSLLRLGLAPAVEAYVAQLMARLGLVAGEYVAAQYRTGWAWRVHTRKMNLSGRATGCARSTRRSRSLPQADENNSSGLDGGGFKGTRPALLAHNARSLHEPSVPVPIQVLSEIRIVSLARYVPLNPMSSFQDAVTQMRGGRQRVHFVARHDVLPNDFATNALTRPSCRSSAGWARGAYAITRAPSRSGCAPSR